MRTRTKIKLQMTTVAKFVVYLKKKKHKNNGR